MLGCVQCLDLWEPSGNLLLSHLGLLEPAGTWVGQRPKFVGVHWEPPGTTRIGLLLGQAGAGIHMKLGAHFTLLCPVGRCHSPCWAAWAWGRGNKVM